VSGADKEEDERLREGLRGTLSMLSGERLRKVGKQVGEALTEEMNAANYATAVASGRLTHINNGKGGAYCGDLKASPIETFFGVIEGEDRPDLCPACRSARAVANEARREANETRTAKHIATKQRRRGTSNKSIAAEEFVLAHPEGVTNAEVGEHIGQPERTAESTLRYVRKTRGTVERRADSRWYTVDGETRKARYQQAIVRVLAAAKEPLGPKDVLALVEKVRPDATLKAVGEELHRMHDTKPPLVIQRGEDEHGLLYCLPTGGEPPSAVH
jgi:hypothetical protein